MQYFARSLVLGACCLCLIRAPDLVSSMRAAKLHHHNSSAKVKESQLLEVADALVTDAAPAPVAVLIASTVASTGSLFSMWRTNRAIELNKQQAAAAELLASSYKDQADGGCRMLNKVASSLENKRQGLAQLIADGRDDEHPLKELREQDAYLMEHFEKHLRENLISQCEVLNVPNASAYLKLAQSRCVQAVQSLGHIGNQVCRLDSGGLSKALSRVEVTAARLDGLMAGICDGLPGFKRVVQSDLLRSPGSSILERRSAQKSKDTPNGPKTGHLPCRKTPTEGQSEYDDFETDESEGVPWAATRGYLDYGLQRLDFLSVLFYVIGTMDQAVELYTSALTLNDGYGILSDLVEQNKDKQRKVLQKSFEVYWRDVAWTRSVLLAGLDIRYQAASLPVPKHLRTLKRVESPADWALHDTEILIPSRGDSPTSVEKLVGSYWVCHEQMRCLVPLSDEMLAETAEVELHPMREPLCMSPVGDFRMCARDPFAIAPRKCFSLFFRKIGSKHDLGSSRDAWILHFGSNDHLDNDVPGLFGVIEEQYDEGPCLAPLHSLVEANLAEDTLRKSFLELDVPDDHGVLLSGSASVSDATTAATRPVGADPEGQKYFADGFDLAGFTDW